MSRPQSEQEKAFIEALEPLPEEEVKMQLAQMGSFLLGLGSAIVPGTHPRRDIVHKIRQKAGWFEEQKAVNDFKVAGEIAGERDGMPTLWSTPVEYCAPVVVHACAVVLSCTWADEKYVVEWLEQTTKVAFADESVRVLFIAAALEDYRWRLRGVE